MERIGSAVTDRITREKNNPFTSCRLYNVYYIYLIFAREAALDFYIYKKYNI